jgi:hypothetical protein
MLNWIRGDYMKTMRKLSFSIILFFTANCFAVQAVPDELTIQYQKNFNIEYKEKQNVAFELRSISQIPEVTYRYLEDVFASFYKKITFNTSITDSTFDDSLQSELVAIPLIATNKKGVQLEVFGNFSDQSKQYLSNLPADHPLYDYFANSEQTDLFNSDLSLGAGISFNTGRSSKIKVIISNNEMPGYGSSTTLLGFETRF